MNTHAGKTLGRYRLERSIGQGGMAEVYRGWDEKLERPVAVKVILPDLAADPQFHERFLREARLVAALEHPNILPVYDFGEEEGLSFLVMPLLDGGTLEDRLRGEPLPLGEVAEIVDQLAGALDTAHAAGILHRDVKPANVLVGGDRRPVLADFGIAKLFDGTTRLTQTGVMVGTPIYMAPEIARGETASAASDLYSLACLAFQLLTGDPPFSGENALSLLHQHVHQPVPSLNARGADLPPALDEAVARGLAKDPRERPASCRAFAEALRQGEQTILLPRTGPVTAERDAAGPAGSPHRRRGLTLAAGLAVVLAAAVLLFVAQRRGGESGRPAAAVSPSLDEEQEGGAISDLPLPPPAEEVPAASESSVPEVPTAERPVEGEPISTPREVSAKTSSPSESAPGAVAERSPLPAAGPRRRNAADLDPAALEVLSRLASRAQSVWTRRRPDRAAFEGLRAEILEAEEELGENPLLELLSRLVEGGIAYTAGDDETARRHLLEVTRQGSRLAELVSFGALRWTPPDGPLPDWQLALSYGDARGEAAGLIEAREAVDPRPALDLARAFLAHLDGAHRRAENLAEGALEEMPESRRQEILLFLGEEALHDGRFSAAAERLQGLREDPRMVRRAVRGAEVWGGPPALRRLCGAGFRPACASSRRR